MAKFATCSTLILADGATGLNVYAVMIGPMRGKKSFNAHTADIVATYKVQSDRSLSLMESVARMDKLLRDLTARHATANAPAVPWQV